VGIFFVAFFGVFFYTCANFKRRDKMPFWTKLWVLVPPVVLLAITIAFYIVSGKKREE